MLKKPKLTTIPQNFQLFVETFFKEIFFDHPFQLFLENRKKNFQLFVDVYTKCLSFFLLSLQVGSFFNFCKELGTLQEFFQNAAYSYLSYILAKSLQLN